MNSGQISVIPSDQLSRPPGGSQGRGGCRSRQTDSRSQPPLELGRDTDAPLLFWEVDSCKEFTQKRRNSGGGGGSGTSVVTFKFLNSKARMLITHVCLSEGTQESTSLLFSTAAF